MGTQVVVGGAAWTVTLEWNDNAGSGWRESAVVRSVGIASPLVVVNVLGADDNYPGQRDNDYNDLVVTAESLDPIFEVAQRPFALDRGTLTMSPDGIFDVSQGVQYMGVRIRNAWQYDWEDWMGVQIGISNASRIALQGLGIHVLDAWSAAEQQALQQEYAGGFVRVPWLRKAEERTVYFKVDMRNAGPGKPEVGFVAQRSPWDTRYDEPTRVVGSRIFVSRSTYDPVNRELVGEVPEGTVYMRLNRIVLDKFALKRAMREALRDPCRRPPAPPGGWGKPGDGLDEQRLRDELRRFLEDLLRGKQVDPCKLRALLDRCCEYAKGPGPGAGPIDDPGRAPGEGGLGDGPGADSWCRFRPFSWIPLEFEYRIVPRNPFPGQLGPLAFQDPWWKVVLIILAVLLAIASIVYDYIFAGQDPNFVIGTIAAKSDRATSNVDAALAILNNSRGRDLGILEAQADDVNNGLPISGTTGGVVALDRSDNGNRGIGDAVGGNVVFKSGARSGTTRGTVQSVSFNTTIDGIAFTNQVLIMPLPAPNNQPLSQSGDSGSLWVDLTSRRPVALNFAGPKNDDGSFAVANPIRQVVNLPALNIHFNT